MEASKILVLFYKAWKVNDLKNRAVKTQRFDRAAKLRDLEREYLRQLPTYKQVMNEFNK